MNRPRRPRPGHIYITPSGQPVECLNVNIALLLLGYTLTKHFHNSHNMNTTWTFTRTTTP